MLLAPAGTPPGVVDRLSAEVGRIVRDQAMAAKLQDLGFVVEGLPPARTGDFLRSEVERWGAVIRSANVTVE
jgi:tripartite-type tricarboxylate transporter receptor subunit TctC